MIDGCCSASDGLAGFRSSVAQYVLIKGESGGVSRSAASQIANLRFGETEICDSERSEHRGRYKHRCITMSYEIPGFFYNDPGF